MKNSLTAKVLLHNLAPDVLLVQALHEMGVGVIAEVADTYFCEIIFKNTLFWLVI